MPLLILLLYSIFFTTSHILSSHPHQSLHKHSDIQLRMQIQQTLTESKSAPIVLTDRHPLRQVLKHGPEVGLVEVLEALFGEIGLP